MTQLLLIRHCEATGQEPEAPLSPKGQMQAADLARRLTHEPIGHIATSPYLRAQQTISPLSFQLGLTAHADPRLVEHHLAFPPVPEWREWVARSFKDPDIRAPGGDAPIETLARGLAALDDVASLSVGLGVLVTHGLLLALILHSIDPGFGFDGWASLSNPDVFRVSGNPNERRFERLEI
ncbi:MAG: histidine phosphatase family protein [Myxococcota bacterium]